ncbi:MAG: hypothetical protein KDA46_10025, partial [Parvularculaceae bacterium]|nr:hypothetical protein [Parvularculaceae bacterium]
AVALTAAAFVALNAAAAQTPDQLPAPVNHGDAWRIVKTAWDEADETGYAQFVQAIGRSTCTSLESCLAVDANPYFDPDDEEFHGDCADMAYILRAYFAWKNALPFSYQAGMRTADGAREDLRYSSNGNVVTFRRDATGANPVSAKNFIGRIGGEVSTAMFRTHPDEGGGNLFDDFYPVAINRDAVRPGVLAYDIYGHVGIVYDVTEDGRILVIASHPDRTVTRTVYGSNFLRAKPDLGAGLKGWRPIRLEGARRRDDGSYAGGRIVASENDEIEHYSMEQFIGNHPTPDHDWRYADFIFEGRQVDFYDYLRRRLAAPGFAYDPVEELRYGMQTICGAARDRKAAVESAVSAGFPLKDHPERLPPNIFGTYGPWESYSTPSRDARLKVSFIDLRRTIQELVDNFRGGEPGVKYAGADLERDLWETYVAEKDACTFTYWRSDDSRMRLNLGHLQDRLWDISFDPYHCPERRWGASGPELATCTDDQHKTRWYNAQRWLRYQAERTYDVRMDFTVDELKPPSVAAPEEGGLGVEQPADADLRQYLASLNSFPLSMLAEDPEIVLAAGAPVEPEPRLPAWHSKILNGWTAEKP